MMIPRLVTKEDVTKSLQDLTQDELDRFVCEHEGLIHINEFRGKTMHLKRFGFIQQIQIVRQNSCDNTVSWSKEYYSCKTGTVYSILSYKDNIVCFHKISFEGQRIGENVQYVMNNDIGVPHAICQKHDNEITTIPTWLGNYFPKCSLCRDEDLQRLRSMQGL